MIPDAEQPDGRQSGAPNKGRPHESKDNRSGTSQDHLDESLLDDELLSAYIDGALTDEQLASVQLRLEKDPAARQLVAELQEISRAVRCLPRHRLDEEIRQSVLRRAEHEMLVGHGAPAIQEHTDQVTLPSALSHMGPRRWIWAAMAIAAVLLLMFFQQPGEIPSHQLAQAPSEKRPSMETQVETSISEQAHSVHTLREDTLPNQTSKVIPVPKPRSIAQIPDQIRQPAFGEGMSRLKKGRKVGVDRSRGDDQSFVVVHVAFGRHSHSASLDKFDTWLNENQIKYISSSEISVRAKQDAQESLHDPEIPTEPGSQPGLFTTRINTEQIAVEALPEQLNGLLQACRNDANVETVIQLCRPNDSDSMAWDMAWDSPVWDPIRMPNRHKMPVGFAALLPTGSIPTNSLPPLRSRTKGKRHDSRIPDGPFDFELWAKERKFRNNEEAGQPVQDHAANHPMRALFVLQWQKEEGAASPSSEKIPSAVAEETIPAK